MGVVIIAVMKLIIDDEAVTTEAGSMEAALEHARRHLATKGRIIVAVAMNGRMLFGEELVSQRDADVAGSELRIESADPSAMVLSTLGAMKKALHDLVEMQKDAARLLRAGNLQEGVQLLGEVFEIWKQTQDGVSVACEVAGFKLEEHLYDGRSVGVFVQHLLDEVEKLHNTLQKGDYNGVATLLEGDWAVLAGKWEAFVGQIVTWIEARR
jgi:hypothetical protein